MAKRVLMAMSGGIDSTVAALLLLKQGYELVGITFRTFDSIKDSCLAKEKGCCSIESIMEAKQMAHTLGFEHHILDFRETFRQHVIRNFINEYTHGRTPNPCVLCNSHIKWGELITAADTYQCDYIATGHYARIAQYRNHYYLQTAVDTRKDQTYFLWMLTEDNLQRTIFPLGGLTKTEVRQIAFDHGFVKLSKKNESQEICFIPNNDYRQFLAEQGVEVQPGNYIAPDGTILGQHAGFCHYTIGQRKGLGIALGTPRFVTHINAETNEVTLGNHDDLLTTSLIAHQARLRDIKWLQESPTVEARIRYRSPALPATLTIQDITTHPLFGTRDNTLQNTRDCNNQQKNTTAQGTDISLQFAQPVWGVTPGQSVVLYKDNLVVGGAIL